METVTNEAEKSALRREFKAARRDFVKSAEGVAATARLRDHLSRLLSDLAIPQTALYRSMPEEARADLAPATAHFYPRLIGEGRMEFWRPRREDAFQLNSFKIPEPIPNSADPLDASRPTVVCCPAVSVDMDGGRLGMGQGYYDRFFHDHPTAVRVGVVFQIQVSQAPLPADGWDQPLDWIVTDRMILRTSKRSP